MKHYREAADLYRSVRSDTTAIGAINRNACYNEGNALAMKAFGMSSGNEKTALLQNALGCYRSALAADPKMTDARINYEIVMRALHPPSSPPRNAPPKEHNRQPGSPPPPAAASPLNSEVSNLLLDRARQEEKEMLRKYYRKGSARPASKESRDW